MKRTKEEKEKMAQEKINSPRTADRLVADELLEMGFSYNFIGTHYLHDSIVHAASLKLEDFENVNEFCRIISRRVCRKYNVGSYRYGTEIADAIERAFTVGNINYLLETFKSSYDQDKMKVTKNAFIMTVRKKIMEELEAEQSFSATQFRLIIQGTVEKITDISVLEGMCKIVLSLGEKNMA